MYVAFCKDDGNWWTPWLHPEISHCFIIQPHRGDWLSFNKTTRGSGIHVYSDSEFRSMREELGLILVKVEAREDSQFLWCLNTCVGHTKQILGINNPFILTPYQLYKELIHGKSTQSTEAYGESVSN